MMNMKKDLATTTLARWDGSNSNGVPVASGVYFYKLTTGNYQETKKMILLK